MRNIDLKNRKILDQLDTNARQSISAIAKKVGLSKEVVNYRIKKLEHDQITLGYYTIIDMSKLGYFSFRVYIKLMDTSPALEQEIITYLTKTDAIFYVSAIDGEFDINFGVWVQNIYEFETFYNTFKERYNAYVKNSQISIFTKVHDIRRKYILNPSTIDKVEIFGKSTLASHDDVDMRILDAIAYDARMPLVTLARKLRMPARTAASRIKQLEKKGVIQGYRTLFNLPILGYEYFKVDFTLKDRSILKSLTNYVCANAHTVYIDVTIGGSDFEFDIEVENKAAFLKIIDQMRTKFPQIRDWKYMTLKKYHKISYFPAIKTSTQSV